MENLLAVKFEELMLYLIQKYGKKFELFLQSLVVNEKSAFEKIVESKIHSNLNLEEIAFLCHMSLSTFERHFIDEYKVSPGKWLLDKRLQKAKETLEIGLLKPSDIYLDFGYSNLSNFSIAFKNKFGFNPSEVALIFNENENLGCFHKSLNDFNKRLNHFSLYLYI
nr:AraC family transcriptional regulator [Bizionia myxarmorum]